ncbi:MAG: amino acid adenylation domain-containing protein, partial [Acidobacteria bacterium]|nr:amino acid adenylation domain-containing protein [Acidobacteriota bacterium]
PLSDAWRGSLPAGFDRRAAAAPEHPAVIDPQDTWSYGELRRAADRLAAWLVAEALGSADPTGSALDEVPAVAIYAERNASLVWALLAVLKAGGAFVVLDPSHPPARQAEYARLARPLALLEIDGAPEPPPELLAALEGSVKARLKLPRRPHAEALLATLPESVPEVEIRPESPAYIAFTSGSTGEPKGVVGRHGSLTHFIPWLENTFGLDRNDRHSLLSALAHDPLHRDVFMPLWLGATIVVPDPEQIGAPGWLARWAKSEGLTVLNLVPAMLQLLTQPLRAGEKVAALDRLRYVFTVGDVLTRKSVAELYQLSPSATCVNYYGSTETQRSVSYHVLERESTLAAMRAAETGLAADKAVLPLGRGIEGVQLLVLPVGEGLEGGEPPRRCGVGEIGEIWFRSHHMALGYLRDPELSAKKFRSNPWTGRAGDRLYRTGDLGRYLPDGEVEFLGRADQQVKVRGYRIELQEIERALDAHPAVAASAVAVREAAGGDRRLAAYVVPRAGETPLPAELRAFLAERLPDYMVPAAYGLLEALPLSATGKLDRRALPPLDELETAGSEGYVAPESEAERAVAEIWRRWLEVERVGVHDNFFDLGGHSLLATQVLSEMQQELGIEVPLRWLFEAPTVAGLVLAIDQHRAAAMDDEALGEMLADLEGLSEEELDALLAEDGESGS